MEAARLAQEQERSLDPRFMLMVMLYPTVLVFSLAGRTGSLWPLTPLAPLRVAAGAEDNPTVLLFTAAFAVTISLVNVGLVCHMTAQRPAPAGAPTRCQLWTWTAPPLILWMSTVTVILHYVSVPSMHGVHSAEWMVVPAAAAMLLAVTAFLLWVPMKVTKLDAVEA